MPLGSRLVALMPALLNAVRRPRYPPFTGGPTFFVGKRVRVHAQLSTNVRGTPVDKFKAVDKGAGPDDWISESSELAELVAYDAVILDAVRSAKIGERFPSVTSSEDYLKSAGAKARARIVTAGLRLGTNCKSDALVPQYCTRLLFHCSPRNAGDRSAP
jgi:hypothetical protein